MRLLTAIQTQRKFITDVPEVEMVCMNEAI